jgi:RNA polymerase sigma-70 factor (ECF subfamily)
MEISTQQILEQRSDPELKKWLFNQLMQTHQSKIFHFVRRMVHCQQDALDITQNTFLLVWQKLHQFNGQSQFSTWLNQIAYRETLHFLKKQKRMKPSAVHFQALTLPLSQSLEEGQMIQWLYEAMQQLPEKQRAVFALKYFEEKKYEEIQLITGTSIGALKASYHIAVGKIENYLIAKNHII